MALTTSDDASGGGDPVRPERAAVVPRVRAADGPGGAGGGSGEALPVEDRVRALLGRGERGLVSLSGPPGSGKTTALRHLAAVLPPDAPVRLYDDVLGLVAWGALDVAAQSHLVVCASRPASASAVVARFEMARWGDDDVIEYLLARHRTQCRAVMARVKSPAGPFSLDGSPELWRMVLDTMAADPSIPDVPAGLRRSLAALLSDPKMTAGALCLAALRNPDLGNAGKVLARLDPGARRLVGHRPVQIALASELIVRDLCDAMNPEDLEGKLPHDLIIETARLAAHWPAAVHQLAALTRSNKRRVHPMAVSVLVAARPDWRPAAAADVPTLSGAYVTGAHWAGVDLHGGKMIGACLERADLTSADLRGASAASAVLRQASLRHARLEDANATDSDLAGADLTLAHANGATLTGADLHGADLRSAQLRGVDFSGADLSHAKLAAASLCDATLDRTTLKEADLCGADLRGAKLRRVSLCDAELDGANFGAAELAECDMEGISLPQANFPKARLKGCYMTGSHMPGANFRGADLRGTGLADVDWEDADLRNADLRGASFHLGSTRSGLVGSTTPCEGSKTGFYTDDFQDRDFKNPEEIRKANLCGADLRGAAVAGVDFYLVDLRRAAYTHAQAEHFRRCGAIMDHA